MQTQTQQAINPSDYHEAADIINDSYRLAAQTVALLRSCSFEIIQFGMPEEYRTQEFIDACWQLEVAQEKAEVAGRSAGCAGDDRA
jgi:hypothetical protein